MLRVPCQCQPASCSRASSSPTAVRVGQFEQPVEGEPQRVEEVDELVDLAETGLALGEVVAEEPAGGRS